MLALSCCTRASTYPKLGNQEESSHKNFPSIITTDAFNSSKIPELQIISDDWGNGNKDDILQVLKSVAKELFPLGGEIYYPPIWINRSDNGPIVLYNRGKKGEYLVNLNTKDRFWCQYAFQFSHEVAHILCGFKDGDTSNLWFEETLCETASLYVLNRLENQWMNEPPYPNWKNYAPEFTRYSQERINRHKTLINTDLSFWFSKNNHLLVKEPTKRDRNLAIAIRLLDLFDKHKIGWSACAYLNKAKSDIPKNFSTYLADWYLACPQATEKDFVRKIGAKFGLKLPTKEN